MRHGIDTTFLVSLEITEHPQHAAARAKLVGLVAVGDRLGLAPQVLAEFIHVVTDGRRFQQPLSMESARELAERWWNAAEVDQVFIDATGVRQFLDWIGRHHLGRKRLLDALLAATYRQAGIQSLLTLNSRDFEVLGGFVCETLE